MDHGTNGAQFLPPGVNPFLTGNRFAASQGDYPPVITGPQSSVYQPPNIAPRGQDTSPSSSNKSFPGPSSSLEYPPITPPHLTHSRRGSRESGDSSTNSTPSTGGSGAAGSSLVHRHKRGHASASMSPQSPISIRKTRTKPKKKDAPVEDEEEEDQPMSDEEDPSTSQKIRREDAKKSRQDAEQKRRDQLKHAYEHLRTVVPGTNEKTSKVLLVTQARGWIEKLTNERRDLKVKLDEAELDRKALQDLNERLMKRLAAHGIDFSEDLAAANMRLEDDPPQPADPTGAPAGFSAVPAGPSSAPPIPGATHNVPQIQPRPGHIRTSSNVTPSQFTSSASGIPPVPMSAPSHTTALPSNYPPLPTSTPTSPLKVTTSMVPPPIPGVLTQGHVNGVPHLNVAIPGGVHPLPSPSSSASSFAPRQSLYSLEGQTIFSSEDPSSSASYPGSATSSNVNVNVAHLELDDWQPHHQHSQPHSPSQVLTNFSNSAFQDPSGFHHGDMQFAGAGFGDHNLGLQAGHASMNGMHGNMGSSHASYHMGTDGGDGSIMPRIPGAFPQDDSLSYGHSLGVAPQTFMASGYDTSSLAMGYAPPQMTFTQASRMTGDQAQYLAHSPLASQSASPSHNASQFLSATPQVGHSAHHLSVVTSPSHADQAFQVHSPLPPSSTGPYPDGSHSVRIETGISPKILSGAPDSLGPSQPDTTVTQ